jgi:peroxiredoxin
MLKLGTSAPDFSLPDTTGNIVKRSDFSDQPLLVIFTCNHCPFVLHILDQLVAVVHEFQQRGISTVMINANDVENYPDDSPEKMHELSMQKGFAFSYLFDESQQTARAYQAACTPDLYLFDAGHKLYYRGQFDDARPGNDAAIDGHDLRAALEALLADENAPAEQTPSLGCNIKWKAGNEPDYFNG